MTNNAASSVKLLAAALFLLIAGFFAFRALRPASQPQQAQTVILENADTATLDAVTFAPVSDLGGASALVETLRPRIEAQARAAGLEASRARALTDIACLRLRLFFEPDFDAYAAHVQSLTGQPPSALGIDWLDDRESWLRFAHRLATAPVSADGVKVAQSQSRGEVVHNPRGARMWQNAPTLYTSLLPKNGAEADAFDVYVPVRVNDLVDPARTYNCFLILGFAWDPSSARWIPWRAGFADPTNSAGVLPYPWI